MYRLSVSLVSISLVATVAVSQVRSVQQLLLKQIERSTGVPPRVQWNESGTVPTFLEGTLSLPSSLPTREVATQFLGRFAALFGIESADDEFSIVNEFADELGSRHVRIQQRYGGVEVWGSELLIHVDPQGSIYAVNGRTHPSPRLSVLPSVDSTDALLRVGLSFGQDYKVVSLRRCIIVRGGSPRLAWKAEVIQGPENDWLVFLDAHTGAILLRFNQTPYDGPVEGSGIGIDLRSKILHVYQQGAKFRMIDVTRSMFGSNGIVGSEQKGNIITKDSQTGSIVESSSSTFGDPMAVDAHYYSGEFYKFLESQFGRSSWDGAGGSLVSHVHVGSNYSNAFWSFNLNMLFFGDGDGVTFLPWSGASDIVAHEITHGITRATSNLIYLDQSGALNESFSDIMAVAFDSLDWTVAEDITLPQPGYIRSFVNPHNGYTRFPLPPFGNQPAHMSEYSYATFDNGGVHINSGIHNKVMYYLSQSLGRRGAARVFYRAFTVYLVSSSQFVDARNASVRAARDLGIDTTTVSVAYEQAGILPVSQDASELLQYDRLVDADVIDFGTLPTFSTSSLNEKFGLRFTPANSPAHIMQLVFIYGARQQGRQVILSVHRDSLGLPGTELGSVTYTIATDFAYPALVDVSSLGITVTGEFHVVFSSPSTVGLQFYYDSQWQRGQALRFDGTQWALMSGTPGFRASVRYQKNATTGVRWAKQTTNSNANLRSLAMISKDKGWAVGTGGTIMQTSTGGLLWKQVPANIGGNLNSISFVDSLHGWIVGDISDIWLTNNGGATWQSVSNPTINNLKAVQFLDSATGWAAGNYGTILKSTDGGLRWAQQSASTLSTLYGVAFINPQQGWTAGANGTILSTSDGGATWTAQVSPVNETFYDVEFIDNSTGWIVGSNGVILKTTDGGTNWLQQISPTTNALRSLSVSTVAAGYAVGFFGTLVTTTDGVNWRRESSGLHTNYWAVQAVDANNVWIAGEGGVILNARAGSSSTVDAPAKLAILTQPTNTPVGMLITPAVRVGVQDAGGNIVSTSNATVTIAIANNPSAGTLSGTTSVAAVNGVATFSTLSINKAGVGYTLLATSGSLNNAVSASFNITLPVIGTVLSYDSGSPTGGVYEPRPNDGWVIANRLTAPSRSVKILALSYYITGDQTGGGGSFVPVIYSSSTVRAGVPAQGPMYVGSSYTPRIGWNDIDVSSFDLSLSNTSSEDFFVGVRYNGTTEPLIGYVGTSNGRAWEYDPTRAEWTAFDAMQPPFATTLFIRATITTPTGIAQLESSIPKNFELSQNYPNPFNPSTVIQFGVPREVAASLKVYNINGEEIATLVKGTLSPGVHKIEWNGKTSAGSAVASGVYVYRLQTESALLSRKLILLR